MSRKQTIRREFTRARLGRAVQLHSGSGDITGRLRDLSLNGAFLEGTGDVSAGSECTLEILLGDESSAGPRVEAHGHVVRVDSEGIAIAFDEIPHESWEHLTRLVRLHSSEPESVDEEVGEHLGLRRR